MITLHRLFRGLAAAAAVAVASLAAVPHALADKLHMKDGRVLEGTIVREGEGFLFFKIKVGTVESQTMFMKDEILKIERDDPAPKTDEALKAETAKAEAKKPETRSHTGATRVCILNFGPPSSWGNSVDNMVGREISVEAFKKAIPLLEKAKTDIVVIRINSGGGMSIEMTKLQDLFEQEYKPRFRTVAWIESAISAAAMSPWTLEEYYFLPQGNMGACTEFSGGGNASKGFQLEMILARMEKASALGKKDPRIMRAMQIQEPLSVDVDENGEVHWRQDEDGQYLLNPRGKVFTINAGNAVKFKFARGIAANKEELAKAMGLQEVEWVAQDATELMDKSLRDNDAAFKNFNALREKYGLAVSLADQLQDKVRRGQQIAAARRHLAELRRGVGLNPNFKYFVGMDDDWFQRQEEILRAIAARP